jgi:DNA-binding LacI/PurR family transcriptional regulator
MASTMKDVAKLAAVSTATVSRALNNPESVDPFTREQVFKAVESLGYQMNTLAQRLRTQHSARELVVILDSLRDAKQVALIERLEPVLSAHGYRLVLCLTHSDASRTRELQESLLLWENVLWLANSDLDGVVPHATYEGSSADLVQHILEMPHRILRAILL